MARPKSAAYLLSVEAEAYYATAKAEHMEKQRKRTDGVVDPFIITQQMIAEMKASKKKPETKEKGE